MPAPIQTGDFCEIVTPEILEGLKVQPGDGEPEEVAKLRLFGRYLCICEQDCPK